MLRPSPGFSGPGFSQASVSTEGATMKNNSKLSAVLRSMKGLLFCSALLVSIVFMAATAVADSCSDLVNLTLSEATITTAYSITSGSFTPENSSTPITNLPPFCRVVGFATPTSDSHIEFEVWIPEGIWNEKYLQAGCGGLCGSISFQYTSMADSLRRGYAAAATDDGHEAPATDASWALGHPEKVIDYAYRAVTLTAADAKAIIDAYELSEPILSYFEGCSDGGREALMEAQRFPEDFDGIIVGDPGIDLNVLTGFVWDWLAQLSPGSSLTQSNLNILSSAVLAKCAGRDGGLATDQFLNNPPACNFNPQSLLCTGHKTSNCLSQAKLTAIEKIYSGPPSIFPGYKFTEGTEVALWPAWITDNGNPALGLGEVFAQSFFSDLIFPGTGWTPTKTTIKQDARALQEALGIEEPLNPDLRPFRAEGGKLIHYSGWSDPAVAAKSNINYYTSVTKVAGGLAATEDFYRMFMVPGMGHCGGGPGANAFGNFVDGPSPSSPSDDLLSALDQWVELGIAPDEIIATKYVNDNPANGIAFQRPLCPYPQHAAYSGSGDPSEASNWECTEP
jgi:Tannase and feruloyl esterase